MVEKKIFSHQPIKSGVCLLRMTDFNTRPASYDLSKVISNHVLLINTALYIKKY
jgi:hypothetical protein